MTKMESWLMGTTETQSFGVEREANLFHLFFVMSRKAKSDVRISWISLPPMITGGHKCGNNAV